MGDDRGAEVTLGESEGLSTLLISAFLAIEKDVFSCTMNLHFRFRFLQLRHDCPLSHYTHCYRRVYRCWKMPLISGEITSIKGTGYLFDNLLYLFAANNLLLSRSCFVCPSVL